MIEDLYDFVMTPQQRHMVMQSSCIVYQDPACYTMKFDAAHGPKQFVFRYDPSYGRNYA